MIRNTSFTYLFPSSYKTEMKITRKNSGIILGPSSILHADSGKANGGKWFSAKVKAGFIAYIIEIIFF